MHTNGIITYTHSDRLQTFFEVGPHIYQSQMCLQLAHTYSKDL